MPTVARSAAAGRSHDRKVFALEAYGAFSSVLQPLALYLRESIAITKAEPQIAGRPQSTRKEHYKLQ